MSNLDYRLLRVPPDTLDEPILEFIKNSDMQDMGLPLPEFGWIACLNEEGYPIVGYVAGHRTYATRVFIDTFVVATQFRSRKLGSNLMYSFLKDMRTLGFSIVEGTLEPTNKEVYKYYDNLNIPYTPCHKLELTLEDAILKLEDCTKNNQQAKACVKKFPNTEKIEKK